MSYLKFQHVFGILLIFSALSGFVIPRRYTERAQPQLQSLFSPVSEPVRHAAAWAYDRVGPTARGDGRRVQDVAEENAALRERVAYLQRQLGIKEQRDAEQRELGPVGDISTAFPVSAQDAGTRESLILRGSTMDGLRDNMIVVCPQGVVGTIQRAGVAGAQVRLVTDIGFRVAASFARFRNDEKGQIELVSLPLPAALLEGVGQSMLVRNLPKDIVEKAGLAPGDRVVVNDEKWPEALQGMHLGTVKQVGPRRDAPLLAEIRVEPTMNPLRLRSVRVVMKDR